MSELTWSLKSSREAHSADKEAVEYRKRVGDFSGLTKSTKKKKTRSAEEVLQQEKGRSGNEVCLLPKRSSSASSSELVLLIKISAENRSIVSIAVLLV